MSLARVCSLLLLVGCGAGERAAAPEPGPRAPIGPVVQGRLVDVEGRGIEDAQVLLAPWWGWSRVDQGDYLDCALPDERRGRSDEDGRFRIPAPPPGLLRVVVRKRGYAELDWQDGLTLVPGADLELGELAVARAAVVRGRVVDEEGQGIAGAELYRTWAEGGMYWTALDLVLARSDAQGRFTIDVLPHGNLWGGANHEIGARAPGFFDLELDLRLSAAGGPVRWRADDGGDKWREDELIFTLTHGTTLHGHVRGPEGDGAPRWVLVFRTQIDVRRSTGFYGQAPIDWGLTREMNPPDRFGNRILPVSNNGGFIAGAFARPGPVHPGGWEAYAARPVMLTPIYDWRPWVVPAGPTVRVDDFEDDEPVELLALPLARAELRVVDAESGQPIEELAVCVAPAGWRPKPLSTTRFPDGHVEVEGHTEALNLWIAALGYRPSVRGDWQVVPGETVDLGVVELEPAPAISVRVIDAITGAPIVGARVGNGEAYSQRWSFDAVREMPAFREAVTDSAGRALLNRGTGRSAEVWAVAPGYGETWEPDWNLETDELDQEIALLPARRANVLVTDADGAPVAGLPVLVDTETEPVHFTDRDGRIMGIDDPPELRVYVPGAWRDERELWSTTTWEAPKSGNQPAAGLPHEIALQLPPLLPIEVLVLDSSQPLAGPRWGMAWWDEIECQVDARGRLLGLEHAPPGPLELAVWWPECEQPVTFHIIVVPEVQRYVVDLARLDGE